MASKGRQLSKIIINKDKSINLKSLNNSLTAVSDEVVTAKDYIALPVGTAKERGKDETGAIRYNTDINNLEYHDSVKWVPLRDLPVVLSDVKGNIVHSYATTLTLNIIGADNTYTINIKDLNNKILQTNQVTFNSNTAPLSITATVYNTPVNTPLLIELVDKNKLVNYVKLIVKEVATGGSISVANDGLNATNTFTSNNTFYPHGTRKCHVAIVGGGGGGGKGVYDHEASGFTANHVSGGGGGGGHYTEWQGTITSNTSVTIGSGGSYNGYDGDPSYFGSIKAGGGGGGASYDDDANSGSGGGGGGGASDTYDRGAWRSTVNHKPPATGETSGGWGDGGRQGGGGGGGNKPNDAPNNSGVGGSAIYSYIISDSVGGGGYGGYSHNNGKQGNGKYGYGGGGGGDTSGSSGGKGVVVVTYPLS